MQNIKNDISQNNFKQVYLLYGEERYLIRQYADRLQNALCGSDDQMNVHRYEGRDVPVGEIIDLAETMPFLAERRCIFIKNSGLFKSGGEKLAEYLSAPCPTTFFVFSENEVDKRSKLYKTVQQTGRATEFTTQGESALKRWIAGILGKEGKKITENTAQLLLQKAGSDMENLQMELEKLICYTYERDVITAEDIEAVCTNRISNHIFDMINAISYGRQKEALQLYYDLLALKEPPMRILALIARQCNTMLQAKELHSRGYSNNIIAQKLGFSPYIARKYLEQSDRFRPAALRAAVEKCVESEEAVKQGRMNDVLSVELLIMTVLKAG